MTRILWSGLSGRTGQEAIKIAATRDDIEIAAGIRRELCGGIDYESVIAFNERTGYTGKWYRYKDLNNITRPQPGGFEVIVDFSDEGCLGQVVEKAVRTHVPLISGTSGLSDRQMAMLYDATNQIPVFRGGNFRFKVKKFIDEAIDLAKSANGKVLLSENFYEGKNLPSETAKVIIKKIYEETGKVIELQSWSTLPKENYPCHWSITTKHVRKIFGNGRLLTCDVTGFDELAHDVLEIAKVMANKPVKKGEFYDLDEIWDDLPH